MERTLLIDSLPEILSLNGGINNHRCENIGELNKGAKNMLGVYMVWQISLGNIKGSPTYETYFP